MKLVLASASPRRAELLRQMGLEFEIKSVNIDESARLDEQPNAYVARLAKEKARAVKSLYPQTDVLVLGSDTSVIIGDQILGKPVDKQHALDMLETLSGRTHSVLTAVAVIGQSEQCIVSESYVTFDSISQSELEWYWSSGEPKGKAGAYAVQGLGAIFIRHLEGSFSSVMGLPIYETHRLLKNEGFYPS
ncbi:MAG: septum formation protein Maf [Piscirickettsiaceae bacterium]|nr:MAG: septum formation protein Maf [Piscirickettsiaceae bacterium]PCI70587.1 MAG: septum formation protein Maf [Piscirickettsiaceae bacterium]